MPRFFFHLHNDLDAEDDEGAELASVEAARSLAQQYAREMAAESVKNGHLDRRHFIDVASEGGAPSFRVTFGEVVRIIG